MSKQPGGTSFHMENFKRRSRYALVFILLILAFCVITVLNINTGNVHISLSEIADILALRPVHPQLIMPVPDGAGKTAAGCHGSHPFLPSAS